MSDNNLARRASARIFFDGADITADIKPYLLSLTYIDNEEDASDDLTIKLHDREGIWLTSWLDNAVNAAASGEGGLKIKAAIVRENWTGKGKDAVLDCGSFELDYVVCSGPPSTVDISAVALPFSSPIRQTLNSRAWEHYHLSGIAEEMAAAGGLGCMFLADVDPQYKRVEQYRQSDISFLSILCHNAGLSLKATDGMIVIFDQAKFEDAAPSLKIAKGDGSYLTYRLRVGKADTQYSSCCVSYTDPERGYITGEAYVDDYKEKSKKNQRLDVYACVRSVGEAEELAKQMLRLRNKFARTLTFTTPGNPSAAAGMTAEVAGFGTFDGRYIVKQARHSLGDKGYTTQLTLRPALAAGQGG